MKYTKRLDKKRDETFEKLCKEKILMRLSYSTLTYDGSEFFFAIDEIANAGYNGIEIYPKDWEWALSQQSIDDLRKLLAKKRLKISAVFGGSLGIGSDFERFTRAADIGSQLDCQYVFFVAPGKHAKNEFNLASVCRETARVLKAKGMIALLHNHAGTMVETSRDAAILSENVNSENFGLCFDSVHYALFEDDLAESVQRTSSYIKYVHLKDIKKTRGELTKSMPAEEWEWGNLAHLSQEYTGLGEGVINNRCVVNELLRIGYSGWWVLEVERREHDRSIQLSRNKKELRSYFPGPDLAGT